MKRFITILFCASFITFHIYSETAVAPDNYQSSVNNAGMPGQMAIPTENELLAVIESDDFKNMAKEMGIDVSQMSREEKNNIAKEARGFAQEFTNLPPETQAELMKEIAPEQITKQLEQELPPPQAIVPPTPAPTPLPKIEEPKKEQTKTVASNSRIAEGKKIINKLVKYIEDIELKFGSLARTTPDSAREQRWASISDDLEWTVAALHSMSNNPTLLAQFASNDSQVLFNQTHALQKSLKSLRKKLVVPDTAKLRMPTGIDAARADVVSDKVKESSKQAVQSIIDLVSRDLPSIRMGNRKLFETYAADELKKLDAKAKIKKDVVPEKKQYMYQKGTSGSGSGYGARDSGYNPSSYSPYYGSSSSPSSSDYGRGGYGTSGADGSQAKNAEKDKELTDKEKKEKEEADKKKKEQEDKDKEKDKTEDAGNKKSSKEHYKYDKKELTKWLNQELDKANKEANKILEAATAFAGDASATKAEILYKSLEAESPAATAFAQIFVKLGYIMNDLIGQFKGSDKELEEFYGILDKDSKMKKLAGLYSTYEENYTRLKQTEHEERARNILKFYADKYNDVIKVVRTKKTLENLVSKAHEKLKTLLLHGDDRRNHPKVFTSETSLDIDPSVTIDTADHAVTLLEREAELIRSFEDRNIRRDRASTLLGDMSKHVGYFAHNVMQHLNTITHRSNENQEITMLQAAATQLTNRIMGLEATGALDPIAPDETSTTPTPAPGPAPTRATTPTVPASAPTGTTREPGFLERVWSSLNPATDSGRLRTAPGAPI